MCHHRLKVSPLLVDVPPDDDRPDPAEEERAQVKLEHSVRKRAAAALTLRVPHGVSAA